MTTQTIDLRIRVNVGASSKQHGHLLAGDLRHAWLGDDPHITLLVDGDTYNVEITRVSARDVDEHDPEPCEDYGRNGDSWPGYEDDI